MLDKWNGRIIDSHTHLGDCHVFDASISESALVESMDGQGIAVSLAMPFPGDPDPVHTHDRIAALSHGNPGRVVGVANVSPHLDERQYRAEARRCVEELGFVALKLHTIGHSVNPMSVDGRMAFETAAELGVPMIVHTGPGAPFALPSLCMSAATDYPDTSIVLAHAGHTIYFPEALTLAAHCPNVYLETSWINVKQVRGAVKALGADRVMIGSDGIENTAVAKAHYAHAGLDDEELEQTLISTAAHVFKLSLQ